MSHLILLLVLIAAFLHASWNLLAKRAGNSTGFVWLFSTLSALLYAPAILIFIIIERPHLNALQILFIVGTAALHVAYFLFLQRGYAAGDLSLAYPLARGTAPLLSTLGAIVLLKERPSPVALLGIILLLGGVVFLMGNPLQLIKRGAAVRTVIGYALLTSLFIATYTVWDKYAVSALLIAPILLDGSSNIARAVLLTPAIVGKWGDVRETWRRYRREVIGVALLSPLAYLLVLFAMSVSPVSYVAPLRECSVLIGTFMGTRFLAEKQVWRRLGAASVILIGIVLLAIS
ncbi:MAG TPA: DMT family transporter [Ktedonobacteraceae bacterium]|nr:DMT family transporter [Ktedonobacteraceae bacterium]